MKPRRIYLFVLIVAAAICALILSPVIEALFGGSGLINALARMSFSRFCHQMPERSLWMLGVCLPVCARCTGIFAGFLAGWMIWHFAPPKIRDRAINNKALAVGLGPLVIDGGLNTLGLVNSSNQIRLITGLILGAVAARALWPALLEAAYIIKNIGTGPETEIAGAKSGLLVRSGSGKGEIT